MQGPTLPERTAVVVTAVSGCDDWRGCESGRVTHPFHGVGRLTGAPCPPTGLLPLRIYLSLFHSFSLTLCLSSSIFFSSPQPHSLSPSIPLSLSFSLILPTHLPIFSRQDLQEKESEMAREKEKPGEVGGVGGGFGGGGGDLDDGEPFEAPGDDESPVRRLTLVPAGMVTIAPPNTPTIVLLQERHPLHPQVRYPL